MSDIRPQTLRVGLVGAGCISEFHLRALHRIPNVTVIGVADADLPKARQVADKWKLPGSYVSIGELLAERPDVVHVLTPPATHADLACQALEQGCHVFVEKPLATSTADCDRIAQAAKDHRRSVCVGHSLLRDPFILKALQLVRSGAIGDPVTVDYFRSSSYPPYAGGPKPVPFREGGYPFRDLGIHALYLVEAFLGTIQDLQDHFTSTGRQPQLHFDEWRALLECERGTGQVQLSWNVKPQQNVLVIQGTRGIVRTDLFGMCTTLKRKGRLPEHANRILNTLSEARQSSMQAVGNLARFACRRLRQYHGLQSLVEEFYDSLAANRPAPVTPQQARSTCEWTEHVARRADQAKVRFISGFVKSPQHPVLVTGGNGVIGRHLVTRLVAEGQAVRLLLRHAPLPEIAELSGVEVVYGDLGDEAAVDRGVNGVHTIYHLAATMRGSSPDFDCGTIVGTRNIVNSALKHRLKTLIYMSSLSVLHAARFQPGQLIQENFPLEPFPESRGDYSRTKTAAEQIVSAAAKEHKLPVVLLRPGEVVAPGAPFITSGIAQRRNGRLVILGTGNVQVPMIYVDDLIDAIRLAEQRGPFDGSIVHLVDPKQYTQNELARKYVELSGEDLKISHMPRPIVYGLAGAVQTAFKVLRRPAPLSVYRIRSALAPRMFDSAAATEQWGWQPKVGLDAGLLRSLAKREPTNAPSDSQDPQLAVVPVP